MARYYNITCTSTGALGNPLGSSPWTSYPNGKNDPGALNVEFDVQAGFFGAPGGDVGSSTITIHGVPLSDLQQAKNFSGANLTLSGGMKPGFAIVQPGQSGLLISGSIFQAFGNWVGTDMNINFVVTPSGNTLSQPGNFVFKWQKGQLLAQAITNTLNTVYASTSYKIMTSIANNYATSQEVQNVSKTLTDFSQFVYSQTNGAVNITLWNNSTILVLDGTVQTKPKPLAFSDLIGQPKWVSPSVMQFTTVMRADIQPGTFVTMPPGLPNVPGAVQTLAASAPSQIKYKIAFQGTFLISYVRHVGNFRDPDGTSWATVFQASALNAG